MIMIYGLMNIKMNNFCVMYIGKALRLTSIDVLKRQLEQESLNMEKKFNALVTRLQKSLKQQKRDAKEVTNCLLGINCMRQVFDGENQCMFRKKRRQLEECSTIDEIWSILQYYFSFFDFYIVEHISNELGTKDDREDMGMYKRDFEKYLENRVFPSNLNFFRSCIPDSKELVLVLDSSFDDCELAHVDELKEQVAKMLFLEPYVLNLKEIKQGCIKLVLLIPEFVFNDIFPLTSDQKLILQQLKVIRLDCGTFHFDQESEIQSQNIGKYCTCS